MPENTIVKSQLNIRVEEIDRLLGILNSIGFYPMGDVYLKLGFSPSSVKNVEDKLGKHKQNLSGPNSYYTLDEFILLIRALSMAYQEMFIEFSTVTGYTEEECNELYSRVSVQFQRFVEQKANQLNLSKVDPRRSAKEHFDRMT